MGLESVVSIIPTIGNILSGLLGGLFTEGQDGVKRKYSLRLGDSLKDELDFYVEDGDVLMRNRTKENVCLAFPAQNGHGPETITVKSCGILPLSKRFEGCAENDINSFEVTAGTPKLSHEGLAGSENVLTVTASGTATIGDPKPRFVGAYTSVLVGEKDITIEQIDGNGTGEVVNLFLESVSGSEGFRTQNQLLDSKNRVSIPLPLTLIAGEDVHVGVTISYVPLNHKEYMEENDRKYGIRMATDQEMEALDNAICVNRRR